MESLLTGYFSCDLEQVEQGIWKTNVILSLLQEDLETVQQCY